MMDRIECKAQFAVDDTGAIEGMAWPFSGPDRVGDVIEKGAFASAPVPLPMLDTHDQAKVVGVWTEISETPEGLTVKGRLLIEDVERAREVRALVQAGAMRGLSIGFASRKALPRKGGGRTIQSLDLVEISICAVPAHPGARITSAKELNMEDEKEDGIAALEAKVTDLEKKADTSALTARLDKIETKLNRPAGGVETKVEQTEEQKAFANYLRNPIGITDMDRKAMTVGTNSAGGYLAPTEFASEILKSLRELSPIRQYARVVTISGPSITYPVRTSSTAATWVSETGARTSSQMAFDQLELMPYELATYVEVSKQLLEDNSYNLQGELTSDLAESFAITEAQAFISGDGAGKPLGILSATGIDEIASGSAALLGVDDEAIYDNLVDLFAALPTAHAQNGIWVMSRKTVARLRKIKDSAGWPIWSAGNIVDGSPASLLGRPVVEMVDMPDVAANAVPIIFGDWSGYRIVDRVGLEILSDPYSGAKNGIHTFHARRRVGGGVTSTERFVKLKVAAS